MAKNKDELATEAAEAAKLGDFEKVKYLVMEGVNVNTQCGTSHTLLDYAASKGNLDAVVWLLDHGADPNIVKPGVNNITPFLQAVYNGYPNVVKCLHTYNASHKVDYNIFKWATRLSEAPPTVPLREYGEVCVFLLAEDLFMPHPELDN